jgi:hypothetical protein
MKADVVLVTKASAPDVDRPELDHLWKDAGLEVCMIDVSIQPYSRRAPAMVHAAAATD